MCVECCFEWFRGPTAEHQAFGGWLAFFRLWLFRLIALPGTTSRSTAHSSAISRFLRIFASDFCEKKLLSIQGWCCVACGWRGAASRHWWWAFMSTMRTHETCYRLRSIIFQYQLSCQFPQHHPFRGSDQQFLNYAELNAGCELWMTYWNRWQMCTTWVLRCSWSSLCCLLRALNYSKL